MTKTRLLYVGVTPLQNPRPFQLMQEQRGVDPTVLYLKPSHSQMTGEEYVNNAAFDTNLLSGYKHVIARQLPGSKSSGPLSGLSLDPWRLARNSDIVVVYGHFLVSFWLAMIAAKLHNKVLVLATDATYLEGNSSSKGWKLRFKPMILRWLYNRWADAVYVPSGAARLFLESIGIMPERIVLTPYVVDEILIRQVAAATDIGAIRSSLGIGKENIVFVFCAKFLTRKRPADAIHAFARLKHDRATLLMIGTGPLEGELHALANNLGLQGRVIFTGLIKYSELAAYYTASDVLVFCSDHEPYGLPVNEMMLCGRPVIVSDRIGARLDLVEEGKTGWIYRAGDVEALSQLMERAVNSPEELRKMGVAAQERMKSWTSEVNVSRQVDYFMARGWMNGN